MTTVLLAQPSAIAPYWYLIPLIIVVSLVYSATRYEAWWLIVRRAARLGSLIIGFMAVILVCLWAWDYF
jgi:hypothetical protein